MAFLDSLGATLTKTGNTISSKTKSMVDATNYNSQLRVCENKLKEIYAQIGEAYYNTAEAQDVSPEMMELFSKVKESEVAIDHLKSMIRKAKGIVICQSCNSEMPAGTTFCSLCGSKIEIKAEDVIDEPMVACPSCGTLVKQGAAFCTSCGSKME